MPFVKIEQSSLPDRVEKQILDSIHSGQYLRGSALPSEQELAKRMNVSRTVVREALSRLRILGMVESRKRRGMVVTRPTTFGALGRVLHPMVMGKKQAAELCKLRVIIEIGLADSLFANITEQDIQALEEIIKKEEEEKNITRKKKVEYDIAFHKRLYEAAGNAVLMEFQGLLAPFFNEMEKLHTEKYDIELAPEATHRGLVEILKRGTPGQFREAMRGHLKIFIDGIDAS